MRVAPRSVRAVAIAAGVAFLVAAAVTGYWIWSAGERDGERPEVYALDGPQPGDLAPDIAVDDNVKHYGLAFDLPYRFTTDTLGFRRHAATDPKAGAGPVVVVLGDSFAFGMGVEDTETFAAHLERALAERLPAVRVHNAGIPGYTITDQRELWDEKLHRLPADLVLICHTASDLKEMARPASLRRFMRWDDESADADAAVAAAVARHGSKRAAAEQEFMVSEAALLAHLGSRAAPAFSGYLAAWMKGLDGLVSAIRAKQSGAQIAVILWVEGYGQGSLDVTPIEALGTRLGVAVFAGQRALNRSGVDPGRLFLPDKHFSAEGNRLAARQTADWLLERALLSAPR